VQSHRNDAYPRRSITMEIAAFLMCVSVALGIFLQFDERAW
jgi:hypothetical protein